MSFVSARLDGLVGKEISIPYVDEAIRFLTGFRGVEIWFVPFPARNFGGHAEGFRVVELTGMKFTASSQGGTFYAAHRLWGEHYVLDFPLAYGSYSLRKLPLCPVDVAT